MNEKARKTPDYMRKAAKKYQQKFATINIRLPYELKEKIKQLAEPSINAYILRLINADIDRRENQAEEIDFFNQMQDFNGFSADFSKKNEDEEELPF